MIPWWLIVAFAVFDLCIVSIIVLGMIRASWSPIAKQYPAQDPAADAVAKRFQTFKFGLCNYGGCVHVAADESHLHLTPVRWVQKLGAKPMSIPWHAMHIVKQGTKWSRVKVGLQTIQGPAWCLNLAAPIDDVKVQAAQTAGGSREELTAPDRSRL